MTEISEHHKNKDKSLWQMSKTVWCDASNFSLRHHTDFIIQSNSLYVSTWNNLPLTAPDTMKVTVKCVAQHVNVIQYLEKMWWCCISKEFSWGSFDHKILFICYQDHKIWFLYLRQREIVWNINENDWLIIIVVDFCCQIVMDMAIAFYLIF